MQRILGAVKDNDWGSETLIPDFIGVSADGSPWAEQWFGAHPLGPSSLESQGDLAQLIQDNPGATLGASTRYMFGDQLPYLVKFIAPKKALSLQVHPGRNLAAQGFAQETGRGLAPGSPLRTFQDSTHKPEMLYALTRFEALVGFGVRRQMRDRLEGLEGALSARLSRRLLLAAGRGVKPVVSWILDPEDGPTTSQVEEFAAACAHRLRAGDSPEPEIDATIVRLQEDFPGEPGIVLGFLMNFIALNPGEALFVPTGTIHSYQSGLGLEVMANSDNVIRAGLTTKHVDTGLFLDCATFDGVPPTRIAPEFPRVGISLFRSPVEDFELSVATPSTPGCAVPLPLPGTGPRILVGLDQEVLATTRAGSITVGKGQAAFVPDEDGPLLLEGPGSVAQVSVP